MDYLVKPFSDERFEAVLERATQRLIASHTVDWGVPSASRFVCFCQPFGGGQERPVPGEEGELETSYDVPAPSFAHRPCGLTSVFRGPIRTSPERGRPVVSLGRFPYEGWL